MSESFDAALDTEWQRIVESPVATRSLRHWTAHHPELRRLKSLADVTLRLPSEEKEPILRALIRASKTDHLAARAVLQALIPGLVRIASDPRARQDGAMSDILGIAWQEIRDLDPESPYWVATSVVERTRRRFLREFSLQSIGAKPQRLPRMVMPPGPEEWALARLDLEKVVDFVAAGGVDRKALDVVVRTRVLGDKVSTVAQEEGIAAQTLRLRRWRTEARLRAVDAVAA